MEPITITVLGIEHPAIVTVAAYNNHTSRVELSPGQEITSLVYEAIQSGHKRTVLPGLPVYEEWLETITPAELLGLAEAYKLLVKTFFPEPKTDDTADPNQAAPSA